MADGISCHRRGVISAGSQVYIFDKGAHYSALPLLPHPTSRQRRHSRLRSLRLVDTSWFTASTVLIFLGNALRNTVLYDLCPRRLWLHCEADNDITTADMPRVVHCAGK